MAFNLSQVPEQQDDSLDKGDDEHTYWPFHITCTSESLWVIKAPVNRSSFGSCQWNCCPKMCHPLMGQSIFRRSLSTSVHKAARREWADISGLFSFLPFSLNINCGLSFTGTFGRIFHGVLLDEKDPSKEKQVFVKTVKGMHNRTLNAQNKSVITNWICFILYK